MTSEERYAAAEQAALGFFEAAGFTVEDGKVTAAPDTAKLSYELIVPGGGTGDHPAFAIITGAQESLAKIGIELKITILLTPTSFGMLWIPANRKCGLLHGAQLLIPTCTRSTTSTLLVWKALRVQPLSHSGCTT